MPGKSTSLADFHPLSSSSISISSSDTKEGEKDSDDDSDFPLPPLPIHQTHPLIISVYTAESATTRQGHSVLRSSRFDE